MHHTRTAINHQVAHWLLNAGGLTCCLVGLWLTSPIEDWKIYHQARIACGVTAIGFFWSASAMREDAERAKAVDSGVKDAIGRNQIAAAHVATQPTRNTLRQVEQVTLAPQQIPIRAIAQEIAQYDGHIAWVSKTRSGKTTQMIEAIQFAQALGHHVILLDGKGDERLKAIRGVKYLQVNRADRVPPAQQIIQDLSDELADRQDGLKGSPISLFVDEFNLIRPLAKLKAGNGSWFDEPVERLILQGAGYGIFCRIAAHTSRVKDWGMNTGVLDSLSFVALGRLGAYESIEDLIQYQINGRKAKQIQDQLDDLADQDLGEAPLILTTLAPLGFCRPAPLNLGGKTTPTAPLLSPKNDLPKTAELPQELRPLAVYISDRSPVPVRAIKNNFGRNNGLDAAAIDNMLSRLVEWEIIEIEDGKAQWLKE